MRSLGLTASHTRAIQFVGQTTLGGGNSDLITLPSGLEPGDLVIVAYQSTAQASNSTTWINMYRADGFNVYWKYMGTTPDTTFESNGAEAVCAIAFRNVDPIYPFDAAPTSSTNTTGLPNPPSVTTVNPSSVVVALGLLQTDPTTFTAPSGYRMISSVNGGAGNGTVGAAIKVVDTPGAEDPGTFGGTGTDVWLGMTLPLRSSAYATRTVATGGALYYDTMGGYIYHKFTANGDFVVSTLGSTTTVEVLTVAGAGGGGRGANLTTGGGGGGGGGVVANTSVSITASTYAVVVGGGGSGSTAGSVKGGNGSDSTFASTTVVATGGGGGGSATSTTGANGGSGGGGGHTNTSRGLGGTGTAGQGNAGGNGDISDGSGGGGGASTAGENGAVDGVDNGGDAGDGTQTYQAWLDAVVQSVDSGRVGGGGGGAGDVTAGSATNNGGGGAGAVGTGTPQAGDAFSGGGGGGAQNANGGNGGSGLVIVRYLL